MPAAPVLTSRYLQTNATVLALAGDAGVLVVDAPYFPDELEELARLARGAAEAAGGVAVRLFTTHSHFDHVLGRLVLPDAPLLAAPDTAAALRREPARAQHDLLREDGRTYVDRRGATLTVADVEAVEALEACELVPAAGHTGDGAALLAPETGVLCCGDYLSDVELPLLAWAGSLPAYRATLDRLDALLARPELRLVVPGHGSPATRDRARRRLEQDRGYLEALPRGDEHQALPAGRDSHRQREIHRANLERHG